MKNRKFKFLATVMACACLATMVSYAQEGTMDTKNNTKKELADDSGSFARDESELAKKDFVALQSEAAAEEPEAQAAEAKIDSFINEGAEKSRVYSDEAGVQENITYKETQNFGRENPGSKVDDYGIYDEYVDKNDAVYYFLYGTDKLCLKVEDYEYDMAFGNEGIALQMETGNIKSIADEYVAGQLGEDAQKYTFEKVEYQEQKGIYLATYIRKIGDYITDDLVSVFIDNNGEVFAFSAMNRDRYEAYQVSDIDAESLNQALLSVQNGDWALEDILVSMDEESGKLMAYLPVR